MIWEEDQKFFWDFFLSAKSPRTTLSTFVNFFGECFSNILIHLRTREEDETGSSCCSPTELLPDMVCPPFQSSFAKVSLSWYSTWTLLSVSSGKEKTGTAGQVAVDSDWTIRMCWSWDAAAPFLKPVLPHRPYLGTKRIGKNAKCETCDYTPASRTHVSTSSDKNVKKLNLCLNYCTIFTQPWVPTSLDVLV